MRSVLIGEGELSSQNMVFNIPQGQRFTAVGLSLIPYFRRVSIDRSSAGPNDGVYTPAVWADSTVQFVSTQFAYNALDVLWKISETSEVGTRDYQTAPCSVVTAFSGSANGWQDSGISVFPGMLMFDAPWTLSGGSALSVQITPTYISTSPTTGRRNEFKVEAILHGLRDSQ